MSRVLARSMFKKNAPKRSARGVGITSMLEDDVPGYAEGGSVEVDDDRTERKRLAEMLLERDRQENEPFKKFSEGERPQMNRLPATAGAMPQQMQAQAMQAQAMQAQAMQAQQAQAMQAAQMQRMAQMGMLPRFQDGGPVNAQEVPSFWANMRRDMGNAIGLRGRAPLVSRGSDPSQSAMGSPAMDNPEFSAPDNWFAKMYRQPSPMPEGMPTPSTDARVTSVGLGVNPHDYPIPEGGGRDITPDAIKPFVKDPFGTVSKAATEGVGALGAIVSPKFASRSAPSEEEQAAMEAARESRKAKAFSNLPKKPAPKASPDEGDDTEDTGGGKKAPPSDLTDIKSERAAKAAAARQENIWLAMMQAGLAIAGGKSSNAITNIGQGGQAGLASFMALEQQRRRDEDAAMRRDISERELQLQQRRLAMQEPYYQAQTQYMLSKEGRDAAQLKAREYLAGLQAQRMAEQAWATEQKNNPMTYMKMDDAQKAIARDIFLKKKTQEFFQEKKLGLTPGIGAPASRETETAPEE